MNYIKYKDQHRINLDACTYIANSHVSNYYIDFSNHHNEGTIFWSFDTEEERDRVLALIDKVANCRDLGTPVRGMADLKDNMRTLIVEGE